MGNRFCLCIIEPTQNEGVDNINLKRDLIGLNEEFLKKVVCVPAISSQVTQYHQILRKVIVNKKLVVLNQVPAFDRASKNPPKMIAYNFIKRDILTRPSNIFKAIVNSYFVFLTEFVELNEIQTITENKGKDIHSITTIFNTLDPQKQSSGSVTNCNTTQSQKMSTQKDTYHSSVFTSIHDRRSIKDQVSNHLKKQFKIFRNPGKVAQLMLEQLDFIQQILKLYVDSVYQQTFQSFFENNPDFEQEKEICIERILQHFLFTKDSPISYFLQFFTEQYYNSIDTGLLRGSVSVNQGSVYMQSQDLTRTEPILDKTLHPKSLADYDDSFDHDSMEDSSFYVKQEPYDQHLLDRNTFMNPQTDINQKDQVLAMIAKSEKEVKNQKVPYSCTYPIIMRIIKARKFWRKFKLIRKLDSKIVNLFMRKRTESTHDQFFDTIQAEDSKSDILFFILYSYQIAYPNTCFRNDLYLTLRLMHDFDGYLHQDLKYVHYPHFLRFFNILEMLIHCEVCM